MAPSSSVSVGPFTYYGLADTELKAIQDAPASDHSGSMIALYPDPEVARAMAMHGGLPPEDLHVTMAYTGKADTVDQDTLRTVTRMVAEGGQPVRATINGYARFSGPDQDVFVALLDGPDIEDLRARLCACLAANGVQIPRDHGFTAHMTIGYLAIDDEIPVLRLDPLEVEFGALSAVYADEVDVVPFGAPDSPADVADEYKQAGPPIDTGAWVRLGKIVGRVDMVVTTGTVPGAKSTSGEPVEATKDSPAARVVIYEVSDGGTYKSSGRKIAASTAKLARTAPLRTRQAKTAEDGIAASVAAFTEAFPEAPLPAVGAMTTAYLRGRAAWPGETKTSLTADEWALGRVDAMLAACAGMRPEGYRADDDLLPAEVKYDPAQPRDYHGRWIRIGALVRLAKIVGGGTGTVDKDLGHRDFEVNRGDKDRPDLVKVNGRYLTVIKNPDGSAPSMSGSAPKNPISRAVSALRNIGGGSGTDKENQRREADALWNRVNANMAEVDATSSSKGNKAPLTPEEYAAHTKQIEDKIGQALKAGQSTDKLYGAGTDQTGRAVYTPERAAAHREIVSEMMQAAKDVPTEGKAVMAGGLGGAGKSTVLKGPVDQTKFITLNPDDVKVKMAERGMIPQVAGLSPMEASALVHEESSHITMLAAEAAYAQKKNVIWDITMASQKSVSKRIDDLAAHGYTDTKAVFVDIPVEKSVERALARHQRGMEAFRNGKGPGGRYVPPGLIRANAPSDGSGAMSKNRETFDAVRSRFSSWAVYDNSGSSPTLVASSGER